MKYLLFFAILILGCSNPTISNIRNDESTILEISNYFKKDFIVERKMDSTISYFGYWENQVIPIKIGKGYKNFLNIYLKSKEKFKLGDGSEIFEESNILIIRYDSTSNAMTDFNYNKTFERHSIYAAKDSTLIYSTFQNPFFPADHPKYSKESIIRFLTAIH